MEAAEGRRFDLQGVKALLDGAGIPWAVAAGAAVFLYAGNRPPTDIDILVRPEDLERAGSLLGTPVKRERAAWGEIHKLPLGEMEIAGELAIQVGGQGYRYWMDEGMVARRRTAVLEGVEVATLAPEDLIALKAVLQRGAEQGKHDLEDIAALAAAVEVDCAYLLLRLRRMGATDRAAPVLRRWGWG